MARSAGRRSGSQYGRRRGEEFGEEVSDRSENRGQSADSLVADMAKGFVEAQAKIASPPTSANQDMLALLEKISRQLAELKTSPGGSANMQGQNDRQQGAGAEQQAGQRKNQQNAQQDGQPGGQQAELAAIFSQLLATGKGDGAAQQKNSEQQGGQTGEQQAAAGKTVTAQTAAQVLAQAQYELANELEASLTKLKQVISESEKLADRISNLLGQEGGSRQT